ncbi:head-to-tail adaptor [Mycobacterium phage EniyanLRS]|uniref:Head-to-tail adaptor n=2 Tax=Mycobacterium virus Wildcat TaxID=1993859 RepID=A0A0B4ZZT2_9CAUD|nr:head-to-tail adaptor [Mycobacterium phage Cosmo]AQT25703.1 head-to-tail adaptor [Mycobacterium phage EniyanLRS]WKR36041.1 head-to-tail adaptor [Mycobacterium phage Azrael100]
MAALVSVEEFTTFLRVPLPEEGSEKHTQMEFLLTLASDWARELSCKPWLLPADAPVTAKGIILAASRREWNNPKRVSYVVKGPQSATFMQSAYPPGFFTDAEEAKLRSYGRSTGNWGVIETYRDDEEQLNGYLEVYPHGGLMPVYHPDDIGYGGSIHP